MSVIYFSGTESEADFDVLMETGAKNVLMSFMHLRKRGKNGKDSPVKQRRKKHPDIRIFIDSGVYTLRMDPDYLTKRNETARDYLKAYLAWLYEHAEFITCAVNYDRLTDDPENTVWFDEQLQQLEKATGIQIIYVWHADYGVQVWQEMCMKHAYVGFNGVDATAHGVNKSAMLAFARKYGTKVHGFGITDTETIGQDLFYSLDSSTWVMSAKYGRTMMWTGAEFRQFDGDNKQRRNQYRSHFIKHGVDWDLIEKDNRGERGPEIRAETLKMNIIAWNEYQDYAYKRLAPRAYWNKIDALIESVPDVDQLTIQEIQSFFKDQLLYESTNTTVEELRDELIAIFAFGCCDLQWIYNLSDEDVKLWGVYFLGETDASKITDRELLVAELRKFAVEILAPPPSESAKPRKDMDQLLPRPLSRKPEDMPSDVADDTDLELPDAIELVDHGTVDTEVEGVLNAPIIAETTTQQAPGKNTMSIGYPDFIQGLGDTTLQLRARLLVDVCRNVINLGQELKVAAIKRDKSPNMTRKKREWRAAVAEKKFLSKQLPAALRRQVEEYVESDAGQKIETSEVKALAVTTTPTAMTPERAREIGKLGGAPVGNTNAMRHGLYSKKLPSLACDNCPIAGQCHLFRQGHVCAYDKEFKKLKVSTVAEATDALISIVNTDMERLQRQVLFETVQGGVANTDTSNLMNSVFTRVDRVRSLMGGSSPGPTTITRTETVSGPGALIAQMMQNAQSRPKPVVDEDAERAAAAKLIEAD